MSGAALAAAAEALEGCAFRLHGRDPATGLDCIGVLAAARGKAAALPSGYALRQRSIPRLEAIADACGLSRAEGPMEPGDVLLLRPSPVQLHLAIALAGDRFVHAHAGLRRVVVQPGPPGWPVVARWRL